MTRPRMPKRIAAFVWQRANAHCQEPTCKKKILAGHGFVDHRPPLKIRQFDKSKSLSDPTAYDPNSNDTNYLWLLCDACHRNWTYGTRLHRGDIQNIAKSKRLEKADAARTKKVGACPEAVLARDPMAAQVQTRFKQKWQKSQAMPGSKASGLKKKMSGKVERR